MLGELTQMESPQTPFSIASKLRSATDIKPPSHQPTSPRRTPRRSARLHVRLISWPLHLSQTEKHQHTDKQAEQHRHNDSCASQLLKIAQASPDLSAHLRKRSSFRRSCSRRTPRRHSRSPRAGQTR